jgi:outer membrane protein
VFGLPAACIAFQESGTRNARNRSALKSESRRQSWVSAWQFQAKRRLAGGSEVWSFLCIQSCVLNFELHSSVSFSRDVCLTNPCECRNLRAMRALTIGLALCGAAWLAHAETAATNAQPMSLQDCIQQALAHNLDVQIERYTPGISLYALKGSYGGYDPSFSIAGRHDYSKSDGGLDPVTKLPNPSSSSDDNAFTSGLNGLLPWGLTYNFFGNIQETYGNYSGVSNSSFDNTRGAVGVNLDQPLLKNFWIDQTRLNIAVAKTQLKYSEQGLRLKIMDVIRDVERAYYDLIAAKENVKVQEQALQLAQQLLIEQKKRVEVGTLAPLDEKQAESQVASARADVLSAQQTLASAQNVLKSLMTDNYQQLYAVQVDPVENLSAPVQLFNVQDSWSKGMTLRPDLLQSKLDLQKQGIQLRYDRNQLFPQLDLIGTYGHSAGGPNVSEFSQGFTQFREGDQPFYTYGAKLTIPLANLTARNNYKSSKLSLEQALLSLKKTEQQILVEIDNAIVAAKASYERVSSTREARLYAEAALEAEQKKLQSGKSTSFVVLQLQKDLTAARSSEISALADYNKALAELARSEGSTLERRGIDVNVK